MCWLFCVSVLFFTFATSESSLLDKLSKIKWQCADENCSVPISEGYGIRLYNGDDPLKLNFNENDQLFILGKSNDKLENYWLVQADDRKGIVPVQFVKERKIIINKGNQIVTELDLTSIIKPVEAERNIKEAIKPSSPNVVIDGTTLPSYEDETFSSEVVVEDESEEVDEPSKPQVEEEPFLGTHNDPNPIKNDILETDGNKNTNYSETSEGFTSDKVVNTISDNVNTNDSSNIQSFIENSINLETNHNETSQDFADYKVETVSVGSISKDLNNQNITISSEIQSDINDIDTNPVSASDVNVESTVDNVTYSLSNETEEINEIKKANDLKGENNDPVLDLTNTQNVNTSNELPDERYSANADQLSISEKEKSAPSESIPKPESPDSSDVVTQPKEKIAVLHSEIGTGTEKHSGSGAEPNLQTDPEVVLPGQEERTIPESAAGVGFETHSSSAEPDLLNDSEQSKESTTIPPLEVDNSQGDPFPHASGDVFSSYEQSLGNNIPSDYDVPSPTESTTIHHTSDFYRDSIEPVISAEVPVSTVRDTPMPVSDSSSQQEPLDISNTYSYVSSESNYNHNDTSTSESFPNESLLKPEQEKPISPIGEDTVVSHSESPVLDQLLSNQPHPEEIVPETLPVDNSVKEGNDGEDNSNFMPQTDDLADAIQEGDGWFSSISSVMGSFTEMFSKSDIGVNREDVSTVSEELLSSSEKIDSHQPEDEVKQCENESCGQQWKDTVVDDSENKGNELVSAMFGNFSESQMSFSTFLCMVITSIVVLLFSLGYYYLENLKQDTSLVAKINTLSSELFFAQKELASIEEQYQLANENYRRLASETSHNETAIEDLRKELEESKAARGVLEDEIKRLEQEIESLVEEGDEMHRMLAESFSEEERTKSLLASIADLKSVLSDRLQEIVSLTEQLDKEKQEVELLTISLKKSEEKREATEDKLTKVLIDADSKTLAVTKEFEEKITTLERIIEERSLERTNFEKQICELKGTCESLTVEKELAEKELKKAHGVSSGKALNEWLEAKNLRTELLTVQKEVEKLSLALEEAKNRGSVLEEKEKQLLNEIAELNNKYESAEKDKIEALTKLQVLSNYFKEKEIQLQEELGIKEAQWLQKQSEDHTIYEQMRSLREENLSYKAQNDALKKEIIDQEASFKIQIANEEQKAQENWINLRHTERRLKEVQMEAAHLRSRLTALEANPDSLEDKHKSLEMVNGDVSMGAASPPFMLYPPPDFIPPPPLVSPTRPPPLGRLSSPPLTPPAPLSPFEFYPPPPPSPPPPLRVHKPQPREPHRKQKDSQSSNHSSESTEKPIRRGKR